MLKGLLATVLLTTPLFAAPVPKDMPEPWTELPALTFKGGAVSSVAFSPDGTKFAVGCGRTVTVLDAKTWKKAYAFNTSEPPTVLSVQFTPDSKRVAFAEAEGLTMYDPNEPLNTMALVKDGLNPHSFLICASDEDDTKAAWRMVMTNGEGAETGCIRRFGSKWTSLAGAKADRHKPCVLTWVPVRKAILLYNAGQPKPPGASDFDILYWLPNFDLDEPKFDNGQRLSGHKARPSASGAVGDGSRLVTGDDGGEVIVWKPKLANKDVWEIGHRLTFAGGPFHTAQVVSLAVSPDAKRVAALVVSAPKKDEPKTAVRRVYVWSTDAKQPPEPLWQSKPEPASDCLGTVVFSVDGKTLAAAVASEADRKAKEPTGTVRRWQLGPKPAEPEQKK